MSQSPRHSLAPPAPPVSSPVTGRRLPPPPPLPVSRPVPPRASSVVLPSGGHRSRGEATEEERRLALGSALRSVPSWLMSAVVHLSVMIALGLIYVAHVTNEQRELTVVADPSYDELGNPEGKGNFDSKSLEQSDILSISPLPHVQDPYTAPTKLDPGGLNGALPKASDGAGFLPAASERPGPGGAPGVGPLRDGREKGSHGANLEREGGTEVTAEGVRQALRWLAKQQQADGSWSLSGPFNGGVAPQENAAATAMAMLAFQGTGNTHKIGPYRTEVLKGKDYLVARQLDNGTWRADSGHHRMYAHAQCTIVLCELYAMTQDSSLRLPAEKAVKFCVTSQSKRGGWRYEPGGQDADVSVTGWFVMALQSAKMAKLDVPLRTFERVTKFLDDAGGDGSRYGYFTSDQPTASMTAEALLCREWLGWPHTSKPLQKGIEYVASSENLPRWEAWNDLTNTGRDVYFWYYATQALHHYDGPSWYKWNRVMREMLPANQIKSGPDAGSWDHRGDKWGRYGGRLYVTCLSTYILEVYYRHLPIYASTGKTITE